VLDAIDARNWRGLAEELETCCWSGLFAQMAAEQKLFSIEDSLDAINQKLERRHPHVFGSGTAKTPEEVKLRWDEIKAQEKAEKSQTPELLGSVRGRAGAAEASQLTSRAAGVGFDWPNAARCSRNWMRS